MIKTTSLKNATVSKSYTASLKAAGAGKITWDADGLPEGLTLNTTTGKIKGRPEEAGTYDVTFTASNDVEYVETTLELVVVDVKPKITGSLPSGIIGVEYNASFTAKATGSVGNS